MLERCRLFLIVALGESILTTGASIASAPWSLSTLVTGAAAAICSIALWFLIFRSADRLVFRYVEGTSDPTRATRLAGNAASAMVAGLIMVAVANELVISHPHEPATATLNTLLFGGASVVLAAQTWFLRPVLRQPQRQRQFGVAGLLLLGVATAFGSPAYLALLLAAAALGGLALWTARSAASNR
jgi:low temperature requirement protein LtrA